MLRTCSMKNDTAYIVIDTNVLISAGLLPHSKSAQVLALAVERFVIAQNEATRNELETRIARHKFDRYFGTDGRLRHLVQIAQSIKRFESIAKITMSDDATDDKFIELAIDSASRLIISGDPDLKKSSPPLNHHKRSVTQACTLAKAALRFVASVPPAMAMSGLPPPLPPTCWATKFTNSPAFTLPVVSAVTPAAN